MAYCFSGMLSRYSLADVLTILPLLICGERRPASSLRAAYIYVLALLGKHSNSIVSDFSIRQVYTSTILAQSLFTIAL